MTRDEARRAAEEALAMVRRGTKDHYGAAAVLKDALEALLASEPAKGAETLGPRECGGRCHDAVDSRTPCPECAAEMPAPSPARDEVREAAEGALGVLTDLAESAAYWSEYDVPLGIVSRVDFAKARLAAALAAKGGA